MNTQHTSRERFTINERYRRDVMRCDNTRIIVIDTSRMTSYDERALIDDVCDDYRAHVTIENDRILRFYFNNDECVFRVIRDIEKLLSQYDVSIVAMSHDMIATCIVA